LHITKPYTPPYTDIDEADRILVLSDRPAVVQGTIRGYLPHQRNVADPEFLAIREQVAALVKH